MGVLGIAVGTSLRHFLTALMLMLEPVFRISIELFRADHRGYVLSWTMDRASAPALPGLSAAGASLRGDEVLVGITTSQGIAIGLVLSGIAITALRWNAGVAEETPADDAWVDDLVA